MKQGLQLATAVLAGVLGGSFINIGLVMLGPLLIPPPAGVDMSDMESFAAAVDSMGPQHFLFPFLAHALGTFTAARCWPTDWLPTDAPGVPLGIGFRFSPGWWHHCSRHDSGAGLVCDTGSGDRLFTYGLAGNPAGQEISIKV